MIKIALAASLLLTSTAALARDPKDDLHGSQLQQMLDCRSVMDATRRLACYDAGAATVGEAQARHDIVVMDRTEVRNTRRSLFGFPVPNFGIFRADKDADIKSAGGNDEDDVKEINSTVRSAQRDGNGNWLIVLEDGAIWRQTDGTIAMIPRAGTNVMIRRGALGSYFMRIGKQPGVKARREG